jgi:hypothetical protein
MRDLIRETVFGRLVHLLSRGKLFPPEEQRDPSRLQRYIVTKSASTSGTSIRANIDALESGDADPPKGDIPNRDPEKGGDFQLVDWIPNDPEVRNHFIPPPAICLSDM